MPLALKIGGHRRAKSSSYDDRTNGRDNGNGSGASGASTPSSPLIVVNDGSAPTSILRATPSLSSEVTNSSTSTSFNTRSRLSLGDPDAPSSPNTLANMKRLSIGDRMPRTDTTDSRWSVNDDERPLSPGPPNGAGISPILSPVSSSNNSMTGMCPLPESTASNRFPFFTMTLSSTATLSFIALPVNVRPMVIEAVQRAWKHGIKSMDSVDYAPELMKFHKSKGCDGGVWELTMKVGRATSRAQRGEARWRVTCAWTLDER